MANQRKGEIADRQTNYRLALALQNLKHQVMMASTPNWFLCLVILFSCGCSPRHDVVDFGDGRYTGDFNKEGQRHGKGLYEWNNGDSYNGDFHLGHRHGKGVFIWSNGDRYKGDYRNGKRTGRGSYVWSNGARYDGEYSFGKREGQGVFIEVDKSRFEGWWEDDMENGHGVLFHSDGRRIEGVWENGELKTNSRNTDLIATDLKSIEGLDDPQLVGVIQLSDSSLNALFKSIEILTDCNILVSQNFPRITINFDSRTPLSKREALIALGGLLTLNDVALVRLGKRFWKAVPMTDPKVASEPMLFRLEEVLATAHDELPAVPGEAVDLVIEPPPPSPEEEPEKPTASHWKGTKEQAEAHFASHELDDNVSALHVKETNLPFEGTITIVLEDGRKQGQVTVVKGLLHGEEIVWGENGEVLERNRYENGQLIEEQVSPPIQPDQESP